MSSNDINYNDILIIYKFTCRNITKEITEGKSSLNL